MSPEEKTARSREASITYIFSNYQFKAKTKNRTFELTREEFIELTSSNCHYCNIEPKQEAGKYKFKNFYLYNGIDRIDNLIGYTKNNCVSCCKVCNRAKNNLTYLEFREYVQRLSKHFGQ